MKPFKQFITEAKKIISPSTTQNTMSLWHGGNLDDAYDETKIQKKGRFEYGPGLYLITHYQTAQKYSKGSRKLYMVTIKKGMDANDASIPLADILEFVDDYIIKNKRKEILQALSRYKDKGEVPASNFINMMVNYEAIKSSQTNAFRNFLVLKGIDYLSVDHPFGWSDTVMIVLFNMRMIIDKQVVAPNDKIEVFDLPATFASNNIS
jgi:hypothetical protein